MEKEQSVASNENVAQGVSEPVKLTVFGEEFVVPAERVEYNHLRKQFAELAAKQRPKIEAEINRKGYDVDEFRVSGDAWARGFINATADLAVDVMLTIGCYDFDKKTFINKYLDVSPWKYQFDAFCAEIDAVDEEESEREEARKVRSFTAKIDNESFGQGIKNIVGRGFYAVINSNAKKEIFERFRNRLVMGILTTVRTSVDELVNCLADNGHPLCEARVDKESYDKAERLFNNLKSGKLSPGAEHYARMQILALNPYLSSFYEHIYLTEGDKTGELCKTAEFFGFSLEPLKAKAFEKQLGACKFSTAEETESYRAKAIQIGIELRYDPKDVLEDCDKRLRKFDEQSRTVLNIVYSTHEAAKNAYGSRQEFYRGIEATVKAARAEKFYLNDAIPPKKLANARKAFPIPPQEKMIAFTDTTLFGSGKTGLAVTNWGLRWANDTACPITALSWEEFAKLPDVPMREKSQIKFLEDAVYDNSCSGVDNETVLDALIELYEYCKSATFFTDVSPETPSGILRQEQTYATGIRGSQDVQADADALTPHTKMDVADKIPIGDAIRKSIAESNCSDIYLGDAIPAKKLNNAIACMGVRIGEDVYALIDTTVFGSGKTGLIFTTLGIHWKNDWMTNTVKTMLNWSEVKELSSKVTCDKYDLRFSDDVVVNLAGSLVEPKTLKAILERIIELVG